jgi:uncharacterized repeat protein (TIGR03803 family)
MKTPTIVAASMIALNAAMAQSPFSQGTNNLAHTNLANAYANFQAAAAANPTDPANNVYYAMTRLLILPSLPSGSNFLNSVGFPAKGRDVYRWTAKPTNSSGKFEILPGENADEATAQLSNNVLPAVIAAQTNLAQITDTGFTLEMPKEVTHLSTVTIDYGDVLMLRALLQASEVWIYGLSSLNLNLQISTVSNLIQGDAGIGGILTSFPAAFTYVATSDASVAQSTFSNAANLYFAASQFIRTRPTNEVRLFNLSPDKDHSELEFRETLTNLVLSLDGTPQRLPTATNYSVSMAAFFSGKTSPRSLLPQFQGDEFVWNSFPDPTLGGVVFGLTETNLDDAILKHVDALLQAPNTSFTVLASFASYGSANGVILGKDGNLYGTTLYGGNYYYGSAFKVSPSGTITTIYQFGSVQENPGNPLDGSNPNALIQGTDGNLYGTTQYGGANGWGSIFKLTTAGKLTTLYSFGTTTDPNGNPLDGDTPLAALVQGADGNLYGTTSGESSGSYGTVFMISTSGSFTKLYSFTGGHDGSSPSAPLVEAGGNFYGTASAGGAHDLGSIFEITAAGVLTPLYSFGSIQDKFGNGLDGEYPNGLVLAADNYLYGTAQYGGSNDLAQYGPPSGDGAAFRISQSGVFQSLGSFDEVGQDGFNPIGSLVQSAHGTLYGVTSAGGANQKGAIFALSTSGTIGSAFWFTQDSGDGTPSVFDNNNYSFTYVGPGMTLGSDGNFYGATIEGGPTHNGDGTVFRFAVTQGPVITSQPASQTAAVGQTVVLQVTANGSGTLAYHWTFNSTALANGAHVSGAATDQLVLKDVTSANAGLYSVVVSSSTGTATSATATISVIVPPVITKQPAGQLNKPVESIAGFNVTATAGPLTYQWNLNATPLSDGGNIAGSATSNLTINPVLAANAGSYSVIVGNAFGSVTSSIARLTLGKESTKPAVTITSPAANARTNAPVLSGTASDAVRLRSVNYWLTNVNNHLVTAVSNQATLAASSGSFSNWSIAVAVMPGSNTLAVQSVNYSGLTSPLATRSFFFRVPLPLQLETNSPAGGSVTGTASVKGDAAPTNNGVLLNIGEGYSITAKPAANWSFAGWTTNGVIATTNRMLSFIMESNLTIEANFTTNGISKTDARYDGIFYSSAGPTLQTAGMIGGLMIASNGTYSGKLYLAGANYPLAGIFNTSGQATEVITRTAANGGPVTLTMNRTDADPIRLITGAVHGTHPAIWSSGFSLFAAVSENQDAPGYTLLLTQNAGAAGSSGGYGSALIANQSGTLNIVGTLTGGTAFSQSVPIADDNGFAFYATLPDGGLLLGRLSLTADTGSTAPTGNVWWIEPASNLFPDGFATKIAVQGAR